MNRKWDENIHETFACHSSTSEAEADYFDERSGKPITRGVADINE